jgi:flagellar motor switch protein FliN/FliY
MNSFLENWLAVFAPILRRELSSGAELLPTEKLPSPSQTTSLAVSIGDGGLIISADLSSFHPLLFEAGLVGSEFDSRHDYELWRRLIQEAAVTVAGRIGVKVGSIEDTQWTLGLPSAAYELRLGNSKVLLAFTDQVHSNLRPGTNTRSVPESTIEAPKADWPAIDLLLDVELETSLRFGSCEMSLNEVLELGPGDVVELDRHITDPVDLLVGDKIVARGEVVLVNGTFGLRVLEVAEPRKSLESVRCLF